MATKKLTKKELETITELQQKNQAVVNELGNLEVTQLQIDARKTEILNFYNDLKKEETEFGTKLSEKYGNGTVNLDEGIFVPSEEASTEAPVLE